MKPLFLGLLLASSVLPLIAGDDPPYSEGGALPPYPTRPIARVIDQNCNLEYEHCTSIEGCVASQPHGYTLCSTPGGGQQGIAGCEFKADRPIGKCSAPVGQTVGCDNQGNNLPCAILLCYSFYNGNNPPHLRCQNPVCYKFVYTTGTDECTHPGASPP
jgi:hypothetical protein